VSSAWSNHLCQRYIHQQSFDVSKRISALQSVVARPFNVRGHSLACENVGRNVGEDGVAETEGVGSFKYVMPREKP